MHLPRTIATLAVATVALLASAAHALEVRYYSPTAFEAAQKAGQAVALHFHADWCPTCRAQAKTFDAMAKQPGLPVTLMVVDYDSERELRKELGVRSQSTIIVYRGSKETGRLGGETDEAPLRAVLSTALK